MEKTFNFGKIDWFGRGRKTNPVTVEMRYEKRGNEPILVNGVETGERTPAYMEFAVSAMVWKSNKSDIYAGGQCLEELNSFLVGDVLWEEIYRLWKLYHLNGMHAGTPEQEKAIEEWDGYKHDYKAVCAMLKDKGLYEVNYTGKSVGKYYHDEPYKYGHAWLIQDIPPIDERKIYMLLKGVTPD